MIGNRARDKGADGIENVTIDMVAQISGVSAKTVSRVLSNKGSGYSELTRAKVEAVAAQLGYSPNQAARSLASDRSFLIALISNNIIASYVLQLQLGAARRCLRAGYHLVLKPVRQDVDPCEMIDRMLQSTRLHSVILAPPLCEDAKVLELLEKQGVRTVRIAPQSERAGFGAVRIDDTKAARQAADHLISRGHRRIAFIAGPETGPAARARGEGFNQAIKAAKVAFEIKEYSGDFSFKSGFDAALQALSGPARPTAIFAANDEMAFGAIAAASRLQLRVPHDISVIGFDDSPAARMVRPQLTTIRQPVREMGNAAVTMLVQDGGKNAASTVWLEPELILRGSSSAPPRQ